MYRIAYTGEAKKNIKKLDKRFQSKVKKAVEAIGDNPFLGKPLTRELRGRFSYRLADHRIVYRLFHHEIVILILTVAHRREVYKKISRKNIP